MIDWALKNLFLKKVQTQIFKVFIQMLTALFCVANQISKPLSWKQNLSLISLDPFGLFYSCTEPLNCSPLYGTIVRPDFMCSYILVFICLCMGFSKGCELEAQSITKSRGISCNQCTKFMWQPPSWPLPGWLLSVAWAAGVGGCYPGWVSLVGS